jgi:hypothetical protein
VLFRYLRGAWDAGGYSKPSGSLWKKYNQTDVKKTEEFANRKSQATDFCSVLFPEIVPQFIIDFIVKKYRFVGSLT